MDKKFLVVYNSSDEKEIAMWWEGEYTQHFETGVFESFDDAKKYMRAEICDWFSNSAEEILEHLFDGFFDGGYEEPDLLELRNIIELIITQPDCFYHNIEEIQYTDDADHYFAFVCNEKYVIADNYDWGIKFNVHNMDVEDKYYYLELYNDEKCVVSFKLINTEKTIDDSFISIEDTFDDEQITLGSFIQKNDVDPEPIVWDVVDETVDSYFVVSHKCIDYRIFNNGRTSTDWENSEIRKWLNGEFYDTAFSETEKDRILLTTVNNGENKSTKDNVFLLDGDECLKLEPKNMKAGLTDYARARYSKVICSDYKEPHGFWWLREPGINVEKGYDLTHVCANGTLNGFARSDSTHPNGIRPAMWVKK